ncbi:MAG: ornithine cyclodeaminase family protein, partial [Chloroflexota bacterium]
MSTLFLTCRDVKGLLRMAEVIEAVEQAFRDLALMRARMPHKIYLTLDDGDFRAMPAYLPGAAGLKWVNVHPKNPRLGLPTVMATLIYSDPTTGYPLAVMDATEITACRTGAASAIAAKYLARKDAHTLGIIGAGRQSYTQFEAIAALFDLTMVKLYDIQESAMQRFISSFPGYPMQACSGIAEAADADIVCTVTPAREPVLKKEWVQPGTHINAIGADAEGKEELEPAILNEATVVVDDLEQASGAGEINVPIRKGLFRAEDVYATLGEIITGRKTGRVDNKTIT